MVCMAIGVGGNRVSMRFAMSGKNVADFSWTERFEECKQQEAPGAAWFGALAWRIPVLCKTFRILGHRSGDRWLRRKRRQRHTSSSVGLAAGATFLQPVRVRPAVFARAELLVLRSTVV